MSEQALTKAFEWADEPPCGEDRCLDKTCRKTVPKLYRCHSFECLAHTHNIGLPGWLMWRWGGIGGDAYLCSRKCYLESMIDMMGREQCGKYINAHWFREHTLVDEMEDIADGDLAYALDDVEYQLEELLDGQPDSSDHRRRT